MKGYKLILSLLFLHLVNGDQHHEVSESDSFNEATNGTSDFTTDLYDVLRQSSSDNLVVSPLSIFTALAMLRAGAGGETKEVIRTTLKFPSTCGRKFFTGNRILLQQLQREDKNFTLNIVNRLYPAEGYTLQSNFTTTLRTFFGAEPRQVNYLKPEEAAQTINGDVSTATHEKIKELFTPSDFDHHTRLVLGNAIYFKGLWKYPFKLYPTPQPFHTSETETVNVDTIGSQNDDLLRYADIPELNSEVVELPYEGERVSMFIIVPRQRAGLSDVESKLKEFPFQRIVTFLRNENLEVVLPKFKIESSFNLQYPLEKLGASSLFDPRTANFSRVFEDKLGDLYVGKAIHKTFLSVTEVGTEAAGATDAILATRIAGTLDPKRVVVDRPFHVIIAAKVKFEEEERQVPLFVARVVNPTTTA